MGRKATGMPSGPPPKEINMDQVLYWAQLMATAAEVAGSFHICTDTLDEKLKKSFGMGYSELLKRVGGQAKLSLRRYQFKQAEKSATMAIWLGKQWLGQKDHEDLSEKPALTDMANLINKIMNQQAEIDELRSQLHSDQPKTEQELPGIDASIQYMGRSD